MLLNNNHDISSDRNNITNDISGEDYNISDSDKSCDTNDFIEEDDDITESNYDVMDTDNGREQYTKEKDTFTNDTFDKRRIQNQI